MNRFNNPARKITKKRTATILNTLRSPTALDLSRERTIQRNLRKDGKQYRPPKESSNQKNINPSFRMKQFPGKNLIVSNGKLFCNACRGENGLKKTIIENHIKSTKHASESSVSKRKKQGKETLQKACLCMIKKFTQKVRA